VTGIPGQPAPDRRIGHVTVLGAVGGGRYPHGSSLLVEGSRERVLIDPSLSLLSRPSLPGGVSRVLHSHCHEDHLAGSHLFPQVPWHVHALDLDGLRSLDGMMAIYGYEEPFRAPFERALLDEFHYRARPDAEGFGDGHVFELGGARIRAIHAPGHTRGHCFFHVEPDDVLYLGDVDLSSFGPYYGDAASDLEDFERTLGMARGLEARWYATFHHVGVLEGRAAFLARLERFARRIAEREERLLAFLERPRTLDEIVRHRIVYRPQDEIPWADPVERRSATQHLARLARAGRVREEPAGTWRPVRPAP